MTPPSIVCPRCGRRSYSPSDVRERYCGACHEFHDAMPPGTPLRRGEVVRLTVGAWSVDAFVAVASANGRSLFVFFDGAMPLDVGVLIGSAALLQDEAGAWREIVRQTPVSIVRARRS